MTQSLYARLGSPAVLIALCWVVLNAPLLAGVRVLPGDAVNEFFPMVYFNVHSLRQGLAPWWNPYIFGGYPQVADPQAMLFSPLLMAWMLLRADPGMTWFVWGALLHVLVGGLAFRAWMKRVGVAETGAMLGALVFMAGGVASSRLQYVPILIVYCLLPLAALAMQRFFAKPCARRGSALGLVAGGMLVQPVQLTYLTGIVMAACFVVACVRYMAAWGRGSLAQVAWGTAAAVAVCVCFAAPQLLLSYAFVVVSNRPSLPLADAAAMSVDWRSFLTFVSPNMLESLRGSYNGPIDPIETFFYIGAVPGLVLLRGTAAAWRHPPFRVCMTASLALMAMAAMYMVGTHTPVFGWLHAHLPGVDMFRRPSDAAYLLNAGLAILVALSASRMDLANATQLRWLYGLAAAWLAVSSARMSGQDDRWQAASILAALVAAVAMAYAPRVTRRSAAIVWLLAVTVVDYRCFNLNGAFNQWRDTTRTFRAEPVVAFLQERTGGIDEAQRPRTESLSMSAAWKNMVIPGDIPSTQGYGPLRWALYDRWYGSYGNGDGPRPTTPYNPGPLSRLNALLGVAYVVQRADSLLAPGGAVIYRDRRAVVWATPDPLPRLLTPDAARVAAPRTEPTPTDVSATDFRAVVLLTPRDDADRLGAIASAARCRAGTRIAHVASTPTEWFIRTEGPADGWLVLGDLDFPGWIATVDGDEVPFHRANGMFRALCVPAGRHAVRFAFSPLRMVRDALSTPDSWR